MEVGAGDLVTISVIIPIGFILTLCGVALWVLCSGGCVRMGLQRSGVTIPAEITRCEVDDGSTCSPPTITIASTWSWQGREYSGRWTTSSAGGIRNNILHAAFLDTAKEEGVPVTLDPTDPATALPASAVTACVVDAGVAATTLAGAACVVVGGLNLGAALGEPLYILVAAPSTLAFCVLGLPWARFCAPRRHCTPSAQPCTPREVLQACAEGQGRVALHASPTTMVHAMKATNLAATAPLASPTRPTFPSSRLPSDEELVEKLPPPSSPGRQFGP